MSELIVGPTSTGIRISGPPMCLERALGVVEDRLPSVQWARSGVDSEGRVTVVATAKPVRVKLITAILEEWAKEVAGQAYAVTLSQGLTYFKGLPQ